MTAHGGRRHGLTPAGPSSRLIVTLSDDDRAGLEGLAALYTRVEERPWSLAEVVRDLIREAIRTDRDAVASADETIAAVTEALREPEPVA